MWRDDKKDEVKISFQKLNKCFVFKTYKTMAKNFKLAGIPVQVRGGKFFLIALVTSIIIALLSPFWGFIIGAISLIVFSVVNAICVIQPGTAAYKIVLGSLQRTTLRPGLQFVTPFVTIVTEIPTTLQKHPHEIADVDTREVYKMGFKYTLHYSFNSEKVWLIPQNLILPLDENYFCVWLREIFTEETTKYSCEELKSNETCRTALRTEIKTRLQDKIREEFAAKCGPAAGYEPGDDPEDEMLLNFNLTIEDFIYDPKFVTVINELEAERVNTQKAEQKKKQTEILAEAKKLAILREAEGEAEAMRLKGATENEIREKLGKILKKNPELIKEVLAKNFPKVFGGTNTMINLDEMLKGV